jgi:hypothetical protein
MVPNSPNGRSSASIRRAYTTCEQWAECPVPNLDPKTACLVQNRDERPQPYRLVVRHVTKPGC